MKERLQLQIAEPCHENWDKMTATEKGKFCGSCQKQVIDFSGMTDSQVVQFFKKPSTGSVCGRFMTDQLNRDLKMPRKRLTWIKYFFSIIAPAFFLSKASAQVGKPAIVERDTSRIPVDHEIRTLGMVLPTTIRPVCVDTSTKAQVTSVKVKRVKVNGRVVDPQGAPVPDAYILITENGKVINADNEGKFNFIAASDKLLEFVCTSVGYNPENYIYPFTLQYSSEVDITIQMKPAPKELDEVVVTAMGMTRTVCSMGLICGIAECEVVETEQVDSSSSTIKDPGITGTVKYYPNPVVSGQSLHISVRSLEEGYYQWQFIDINGRMVQRSEVWIDDKAAVFDIALSRVAPGTYIAVLINKKTGKRYPEKIIVN